MTKRLTIQPMRQALALVLVCLVLVSCAQPASGSRGQILIAWYTLTGSKERALLDLVDQWNQTNPDGITVVPERRAAATLHQSIIDGIAEHALPGLALVSPMQAAIYQQKGILAPMNTFMDDGSALVGWGANDRADLYPFVMKAGQTANGEVVGIPFGGTIRLMLFNRDWLKTLNLDDAPSDWDSFTSACTAATDRTKGTVCFGIDPNSVAFEQWLFSQGGQTTTNDMSVLQVSTPAGLAAMNRLADLLRSNQAYRVTTPQQSRDDFATSRVLFAFDWSDGLADVGAAVKHSADFDWGISLLPFEGQATQTKYQAPLWVITRQQAKPDLAREKAAWLFIRWLTDESQTAQWSARTGELPARRSAIKSLSANQPLDAKQLILLQRIAPLARPEPLISGWKCVENVLSSAMRQIFDGRPVTETLQIAQATGQAELNYDCSGK
jgi:multiple sugar transport system substrate-binding protein